MVIREELRVDLLPLYIERSQLMWFGRVLLATSPEHPGGLLCGLGKPLCPLEELEVAREREVQATLLSGVAV